MGGKGKNKKAGNSKVEPKEWWKPFLEDERKELSGLVDRGVLDPDPVFGENFRRPQGPLRFIAPRRFGYKMIRQAALCILDFCCCMLYFGPIYVRENVVDQTFREMLEARGADLERYLDERINVHLRALFDYKQSHVDGIGSPPSHGNHMHGDKFNIFTFDRVTVPQTDVDIEDEGQDEDENGGNGGGGGGGGAPKVFEPKNEATTFYSLYVAQKANMNALAINCKAMATKLKEHLGWKEYAMPQDEEKLNTDLQNCLNKPRYQEGEKLKIEHKIKRKEIEKNRLKFRMGLFVSYRHPLSIGIGHRRRMDREDVNMGLVTRFDYYGSNTVVEVTDYQSRFVTFYPMRRPKPSQSNENKKKVDPALNKTVAGFSGGTEPPKEVKCCPAEDLPESDIFARSEEEDAKPLGIDLWLPVDFNQEEYWELLEKLGYTEGTIVYRKWRKLLILARLLEIDDMYVIAEFPPNQKLRQKIDELQTELHHMARYHNSLDGELLEESCQETSLGFQCILPDDVPHPKQYQSDIKYPKKKTDEEKAKSQSVPTKLNEVGTGSETTKTDKVGKGGETSVGGEANESSESLPEENKRITMKEKYERDKKDPNFKPEDRLDKKAKKAAKEKFLADEKARKAAEAAANKKPEIVRVVNPPLTPPSPGTPPKDKCDGPCAETNCPYTKCDDQEPCSGQEGEAKKKDGDAAAVECGGACADERCRSCRDYPLRSPDFNIFPIPNYMKKIPATPTKTTQQQQQPSTSSKVTYERRMTYDPANPSANINFLWMEDGSRRILADLPGAIPPSLIHAMDTFNRTVLQPLGNRPNMTLDLTGPTGTPDGQQQPRWTSTPTSEGADGVFQFPPPAELRSSRVNCSVNTPLSPLAEEKQEDLSNEGEENQFFQTAEDNSIPYFFVTAPERMYSPQDDDDDDEDPGRSTGRSPPAPISPTTSPGGPKSPPNKRPRQ